MNAHLPSPSQNSRPTAGTSPRRGPGVRARVLVGCAILGICLMVGSLFVDPVETAMPVADAQPGINDPILNELEKIKILEYLDTELPLDLPFVDERGNDVKLRDYFTGDKPVILNLAYFSCPMLCNLVVEGLIEVVNEVDWTMGEEFSVLTVSIDPRDTPSSARTRKEVLVDELGRDDAITGWHLLTGREKNLRAVADAAGFGYAWNEDRQEYAHGAVLMVITPDGRIARYLYGIKFDPKVFRLSMVEAADGKVGSTIDKLFLMCFHYDPTTAQYGVRLAWLMMRAGGVVTLLALAIGSVWISHSRRRNLAAQSAASET